MASWHRFFGLWPSGAEQRTAFSLYTADGSRGIDVQIRRDGLAYYVEREHVEGTIWKDREGRPAIGPYKTPAAAEAAALVSRWFTGVETQSETRPHTGK